MTTSILMRSFGNCGSVAGASGGAQERFRLSDGTHRSSSRAVKIKIIRTYDHPLMTLTVGEVYSTILAPAIDKHSGRWTIMKDMTYHLLACGYAEEIKG